VFKGKGLRDVASRGGRLIIPVFVTFGGCPHRCVFCDQAGITGREAPEPAEDVYDVVERHLSTWKGDGPREIAFYGGTFTALPKGLQREYLAAARGYVEDGRIDSLRLSTRPDAVSEEACALLKDYPVETVELGVQSMSDHVLRLSGRGHTAASTMEAVGFLRRAGLRVGCQFMPGLPGDTRETILGTARAIAALSPDFVRIYPTLVLRDTPLHEMYRRGDYTPWGLDEMTAVCREAAEIFGAAGIRVARMGLHPSASLRDSLVAGPFHASFRQLVGC